MAVAAMIGVSCQLMVCCECSAVSEAPLCLGTVTVPADCRRGKGAISTGLVVKPGCLHLHLHSVVTNTSSLLLFLESECKQNVFFMGWTKSVEGFLAYTA